MAKLTALKVSKLREDGVYGDGDGLYLQIKGGSRSWLFRYKREGRARAMGLGPVRDVTLAEARAKAAECRKQLLDGVDPIEARRGVRSAKAAVSFADAVHGFYHDHSASWRNPRHRHDWQVSLSTHVLPVLGPMPVATVETSHVLDVLRPLWHAHPETASRVRGRIEAVLDWATVQGYRPGGANPARWRGHLSHMLPRRSRLQPTQPHPALGYDNLPQLMAQLREDNSVPARALELVILTACRTGEVRLARWAEIDGDTWVIPAERMKSGAQHRVPLSTGAAAVLQRMSAIRTCDFVFPGQSAGKPINAGSLLLVLRELHPTATVHGMRATFRIWAAERTSFPQAVCELALAHRSFIGAVERSYMRSDLLEQRRELMQAWADLLGSGK